MTPADTIPHPLQTRTAALGLALALSAACHTPTAPLQTRSAAPQAPPSAPSAAPSAASSVAPPPSRTGAPPTLATVAHRTPLVGICEPSGAARAPDGTIWLADDDQDHTLFRWAGPPSNPVPVPMGDPTRKPAVEDIEGLAWAGDTLWVMGSHSRNRKGKLKRRARLLDTRPGAAVEVQATHSLWPDKDTPTSPVLAEALHHHCPGCVSQDALMQLNLEGADPSGDGLLVGARAPLTTDGHALVFQLDLSRSPPRAPALHRLDLDARGVRALAPAPDGRGFWIIAGPPADAPPRDGAFALYAWAPGTAAVPLAVLPAFAGSPEALVPDGSTGAWLFIDEGDRLKALSESRSTAPHRRETSEGLKFRCGVGASDADPTHWARAVRVDWSDTQSGAASTSTGQLVE